MNLKFIQLAPALTLGECSNEQANMTRGCRGNQYGLQTADAVSQTSNTAPILRAQDFPEGLKTASRTEGLRATAE